MRRGVSCVGVDGGKRRPEDGWAGATGFIHEVVLERYLPAHPAPKAVEYYLCGPPMMSKSCPRMLGEFGVPERQIAYDEF